jgi:hypothetical protein
MFSLYGEATKNVKSLHRNQPSDVQGSQPMLKERDYGIMLPDPSYPTSQGASIDERGTMAE